MSLYSSFDDDSDSDSVEEDEGLLFDLGRARKPTSPKRPKSPITNVKKSTLTIPSMDDDSEEEEEDSESGWSEGNSESHSEIDVDEVTEYDKPNLVAKGRVSPAKKAADSDDNDDDVDLDGAMDDLKLLLEMKLEEKQERDANGEVDEDEDAEIEDLKALVAKAESKDSSPKSEKDDKSSGKKKEKKDEKKKKDDKKEKSKDKGDKKKDKKSKDKKKSKEKDKKKDKDDKKKDKKNKDKVERLDETIADDPTAELEMLLDMKLAEKEERDALGKVDTEEDKELEKLQKLVGKQKDKKSSKALSPDKKGQSSPTKVVPTFMSNDDSESDEYEEVEVFDDEVEKPERHEGDRFEDEVHEEGIISKEKGGLFSSFRKRKSVKEGGDDTVEIGEEKQKRGFFGSFRRSTKAEDDKEVNVEVDLDDDVDEDAANEGAEQNQQEENEEDKQEGKKGGFFSSFRRGSRKDPPAHIKNDSYPDPENLGEEQDKDSEKKGGLFSKFRRSSRAPLPIQPGEEIDEKSTEDEDIERDMGASESEEIDVEKGELPVDEGSASHRSLQDDDAAGDHAGNEGDRSEGENAKGQSQEKEDETPFNWKRLWIILGIVAIVIILASFGTAYGAAKLASENSESRNEQLPTMAPTRFSECLNRENNLIEFTITFDSKPGDVAFTLKDDVTFSTAIWNMDQGTFRSFSQFQRENVFQICLSSVVSYIFEITDAAGDGLLSKFGGTTSIFGGWDLRLNRELVATYRGDCNSTAPLIEIPGLTGDTIFACGAYDACKFNLNSNGTSGGQCLRNNADPNDNAGSEMLDTGTEAPSENVTDAG